VESRILSSGYDLQQNNSKTKNIRFGGVKSLHCILWCHVSTIQQKGQKIFSNPGKSKYPTSPMCCAPTEVAQKTPDSEN